MAVPEDSLSVSLQSSQQHRTALQTEARRGSGGTDSPPAQETHFGISDLILSITTPKLVNKGEYWNRLVKRELTLRRPNHSF